MIEGFQARTKNALKPEVVMKTKENLETTKPFTFEKPQKAKPRSLRPMRSMVAVRSLKPKTHVATMVLKDEMEKRD
jgi:hypothetical protein